MEAAIYRCRADHSVSNESCQKRNAGVHAGFASACMQHLGKQSSAILNSVVSNASLSSGQTTTPKSMLKECKLSSGTVCPVAGRVSCLYNEC